MKDYKISIRIKKVKEFVKLVDCQYLFFYMILFAVLVLSESEFQTKIFFSLPNWDIVSVLLKFIILIVLIFTSYLIIQKNRRTEYTFTTILLPATISLTVIELVMSTVLNPTGYPIIYRNSFNILSSFFILMRFYYLKLFIIRGV